MIRTVTFLEKDYSSLHNHLFKDGKEQAAFLLCSLSQSENKTRFLVKEVIPVEEDHILDNNSEGINYTYESYLPVIYKAKTNNLCFIMVHCHPSGFSKYSELDDKEEIKLLKYAYNRIGDKFHGSLVFSDPNTFVGRVLNFPSENYYPITEIKILGDTYRFIKSNDEGNISINNVDIFNRNILAFGEELLKILQNIHIGVVGCGGTGSALIEQLSRLGVGKLTLVDNDIFDSTNVTRVHESKLSDQGTPKVLLMKKIVENIGLGTEVIAVNEKLDNADTAYKLKDCDLIFSCLDYTDYARSILNQISIVYYIPIIDTGIKFDSKDGKLKEIFGRIDLVLPDRGCLFCRGIITPSRISSELKSEEEYQKLKKEGYAPELPKDKVQAIPYNTLIATHAVTEMIQLLTNFKGKTCFEQYYRFIENKVSNINVKNLPESNDCICNLSSYLGIGDVEPFLRLTWGN